MLGPVLFLVLLFAWNVLSTTSTRRSGTGTEPVWTIHYDDPSGTLFSEPERALAERMGDAAQMEISQLSSDEAADLMPGDGSLGHQLMIASMRGNHSDVRALLRSGADPNYATADMDGDGDSAFPLQVASRYGHIDVLLALLEGGADIDMATSIGVTALMAATRTARLSAVEFLVSRGANVEAATIYGETPLHAACLFFHLDVAKHLLRNGADFFRKDKVGIDCTLHVFGPLMAGGKEEAMFSMVGFVWKTRNNLNRAAGREYEDMEEIGRVMTRQRSEVQQAYKSRGE